jgi:P27 family predicted phage terminase small subunit
MGKRIPAVPKGLKPSGKALWKAILGDLENGWELDRRELHLLERACRVEDEMRDLEAVVDKEGPTTRGSTGQVVVHPAVLESRQLKVTQLRLLSALELQDPDGRSTPSSQRARRAAQSRHGHRKRGA